MSAILCKIHMALQMVAFVRQDNGCFMAVSPLPPWVALFLEANKASYQDEHIPTTDYDLLAAFPYLSCFIEDAMQCWQGRTKSIVYSGSWIEMDNLGNELPLEASAFNADGQAILVIQELGIKHQEEVIRMQKFRDGLLNQELLEREIRQRTLDIRHREEATAIKLVSLTSLRDEETGAHVKRIGLYAAAMAKALGWKADRVDCIRVAAPMHDIGKIGIPDRILLKAGRLTDAEFSIMKRHTQIGAKMLEGTGIPVLDMAAEIALNHHEKWDGSGYPNSESGDDIPIAARITTIVDVYDALVHERVYKKALAEEEALAMMQAQRGKHFDPKLLDLFMSLLPVMRRIKTQVQEINDLIVR